MDKASMITIVALWATIVVQKLTIRDLHKKIKNEQKWSEYWLKSWTEERNRRLRKERTSDGRERL